jgi:predicted AAA+ superfamily ATPase
LADPESFFSSFDSGDLLLVDEIHRVKDPALTLKIAADEFPSLRILATGSSTLHATGKFKDTLTDRKRNLHLPPALWRECLSCFGIRDIDTRLLRGGLPGHMLSAKDDPEFFEEWIESFYARDILDLFGIRNRTGFLSLFKLVGMRNGGLLDISDLAKETGMSRPTVMSHLDAMETAHAIIRIPPYHAGGHREIIHRPKIYLFDTGMIAHIRGWEKIREDDRGHLWENLVMDEIRTSYPPSTIHYWRDKNGREVDFVREGRDGKADAYEAKINPDSFSTASLSAFRSRYPDGNNYLVCPYVKEPYTFMMNGFAVHVCSTTHLPLNGSDNPIETEKI